MLYFIGGASRSGKSMLVKRLFYKKKVPYFPLDCIMMGFKNAGGSMSSLFQYSPEKRSKTLWPFTEEVIRVATLNSNDYAFEGDYIFPDNLKSLKDKSGDRSVRAIFLGYTDINPQTKLDDIRRHAKTNDWTNKKNDDFLIEHIREHISLSAILKDQCASFGFNYLDASDDFSKYLDLAYQLLTENS